MTRTPRLYPMVAAALTIAVLLAACGGADQTPTPVPPSPTATLPTATPTPIVPTPVSPPPATVIATATRPPSSPVPLSPTATTLIAPPSPVPAPAPTATAAPTRVALPGRYGGTLQTRSNNQYTPFDSFDSKGIFSFHHLAPLFNNLIQVDPYGDGKTISGDVAERWDYGEAGKVITFAIRKNIRWHDGAAFTSKDVAYNFDRGRKPRTPTMTVFKNAFDVIQAVDTPDDFTVRLTLKDASHAFLEGVARVEFQMYPAHFPFPESYDAWKTKFVGTGPFKFKSITQDVRLEYVRNDAYWKPGLPYLDGNVLINMTTDVCSAAFRAGKIDVTMFDGSCTASQVKDVQRTIGFQPAQLVDGFNGASFNQRAPWTDARVREAVDLVLDRQTMNTVLNADLATAFSGYPAPLLTPEMGGRWGLSAETIKTRPGYRADKTQDTARAKQLLAQAGIDPTKVTVSVIGSKGANFVMAEVAESSLRGLGFQVKLSALDAGPLNEIKAKGDFDMEVPQIGSIAFDDPMDVLASWYMTGGLRNYGKWSDPALDDLFIQQDRTLDLAKRRQMLIDLQEKVLQTRWVIPLLYKNSLAGSLPWVKNYPAKLTFLFQQRYRHEQVWLERQ